MVGVHGCIDAETEASFFPLKPHFDDVLDDSLNAHDFLATAQPSKHDPFPSASSIHVRPQFQVSDTSWMPDTSQTTTTDLVFHTNAAAFQT
jgi:hypothetical protein